MIPDLAKQYHLRVTPEVPRKIDPEAMPTLQCARGGPEAHLYQHGEGLLAFTGSSWPTKARLLQIPGAKLHQNGDEEYTILFPVAAFEAVAGVVRPRRKRPGSSKARMQELTAARMGRKVG